MRPNYNVIAGHPKKTNYWQQFYFYVKSDKFAFEDSPGDVFRFLWNLEFGRLLLITCYYFLFYLTALSFVAVEHPNKTVCPEEFIANAHAVASLAQESWENISVERILRVIDRISKSKFFRLNIASFSCTV